MCIEAEAHRTTEFKVESASRSRCEINTSFVLLVRNGHVFFEFPSRGCRCPMLCYCRKLGSCKSTSTLNPPSPITLLLCIFDLEVLSTETFASFNSERHSLPSIYKFSRWRCVRDQGKSAGNCLNRMPCGGR